ncbi:hypothetical protein C6380_17610 [Pseudomonas syringae pv. actinidiae]|nr:hypothetical protein BUE60_11375 [Pseudomonas syringae pv. actinidiae]PBK55531.1 hypothetical protein BUE61_07305 [Pseudomonas syringae pv. actinidiae]RJX53985.1 hypothetical protein C6380_17610 [Pseudomonas syringae pv. actinidiae]RJX65184.1 hypothetical protein C6383_00050 [Pseudomonas syringae pv. actinidiae]RJY23997.1 hypothetical protein C6381_01045 [Pseudomonas syringae pv. actinidiae]
MRWLFPVIADVHEIYEYNATMSTLLEGCEMEVGQVMSAQAMSARQRREIETIASMIEEVVMHLASHPLDRRFQDEGTAFVFKGMAGEVRVSFSAGVSWMKAPGGAEIYNRRGYEVEDVDTVRIVANRLLNELMTIYKQIVLSGL